MIKIGYVRISREDQIAENQIQILEKEGVTRAAIFIDQISGSSDIHKRPGFTALMKFVDQISKTEEAVLYVFEISRIGRSFLDTLYTVRDLESKGIRVNSLASTESWTRIDNRNLRDLMLSIFSWVADRERESLIERTKLGLQRAKSEGKTLGRPRRELPSKRIRELRDKQISMAAISRILDIPYSTLKRNYKESDGRAS